MSAEESQKLEVMFKEFGGPMLSRALSILHNEHDAQDAVSDAFYKLADLLESVEGRSYAEVKEYCLATVYSTAVDVYRKNKHRSEHLAEFNDKTVSDDIGFLLRYDKLDIENALAALDDKYQRPFVLRHCFGIPVKDIAVMQGTAESTVYMHLKRASAKLQRILEKGDEE